jgi:hypothetical protein
LRGTQDMLPAISSLRKAIELYLEKAYGAEPPKGTVSRFLPPPDADPGVWLMGQAVERHPPNAPLEQVRSFALRIGNRRYPFMKVRLTRPPRQAFYVFCVDAHDACLHAPSGSEDLAALERLKRFNIGLAQEVLAAWDAVGLLTERGHLREAVKEARRQKG